MKTWVLAGMALVAAAVLAGVWGLQATDAVGFLAEEGSALPAWWYALSTTGVLLMWSGVAVLPSGDVAGLGAKPVRDIEELPDVNEEVLAADVRLDSSVGRWVSIVASVALGGVFLGAAAVAIRGRSSN